jgi:hypothetical protein
MCYTGRKFNYLHKEGTVAKGTVIPDDAPAALRPDQAFP